MRVAALVTATALALVGGLPQVAAKGKGLRLVLSRQRGAERCPGADATRAAVAARLGYQPFSAAAAPTLAVRYRKRAAGMWAVIEMADASGKRLGKRELSAQGEGCEELGRRVALAIAIAIDPLASARPVKREPDSIPVFPPRATSNEPPAAPPLPPPAPAVTRSPAAKPARSTFQLSAGVGGLFAVGAAPSVNGGFRVGLRLRWRQVSLGLAGRFDLPGATDVAGGGEVSAGLVVGELCGCYHFGPLLGCALLDAGALRGAGRGLAGAENVTLGYVAIGGRAAWDIHIISRFSVMLHADLLGALTRLALRDTQSREAFWETPALSGAFGLAARFKLM
ncbi:MAG: hypothetical protein KC503_40135 [Myxococcales bacterium]|nr:hypothetical protein [Myxococcales bacterium]